MIVVFYWYVDTVDLHVLTHAVPTRRSSYLVPSAFQGRAGHERPLILSRRTSFHSQPPRAERTGCPGSDPRWRRARSRASCGGSRHCAKVAAKRLYFAHIFCEEIRLVYRHRPSPSQKLEVSPGMPTRHLTDAQRPGLYIGRAHV